LCKHKTDFLGGILPQISPFPSIMTRLILCYVKFTQISPFS